MSERFRPNAAAHVLLMRDDDHILMLRRFQTGWEDGKWTTPTGHIEEGEPATIAAVRELEEEALVVVEPTDLEHAITVHRQNESSGVYFDTYFIARHWSGKPAIGEPDKADALEWIDLYHLPETMIVPSVLRALQGYIKGLHYMEDGWIYRP